jgi:predicted lipoprotein with Yx(FWY)xxD motif
MFRKSLGFSALAATIALAACSSGGSGGSGGGLYGGAPPPTSPPQGSNEPIRQTVAGKPGFVDPASNHTLYFLDVDTPHGGTCTGGCLSVWIVLAPSSGAQGTNGFSVITRSDGTGKQWSYKNHPLYNYTGDSGADQANGEGIPFAGGHWHVARPAGN